MMAAEGERRIQNILAARMLLKRSLEKSKALASEIDKTGPRLDEINQRLPFLEARIKPTHAKKCMVLAIISGEIDRATGPASAVLGVCDAVYGLKKLVATSSPCSDLLGYLSTLTKLEEALTFLSRNCDLAIKWLEDVVHYLEDNGVSGDDRLLLNLKRSLQILIHLEATGVQARCRGGFLSSAFGELEFEFMRLLRDNSVPLPMASFFSSVSADDQPCLAPSPFPAHVIQDLQVISDRLTLNRREKFMSIYAEVRSSIVTRSLQTLDLDYLETSVSEFDYVQRIEDRIQLWQRHLEFLVKHLLEIEFKLCDEVFPKLDSDSRMTIFASIAVQSKIFDFLRFGDTVTKSKKDPIKLLKLLEMFEVLNDLRLDFNRLFSHRACEDIRNATRDLIRRIVNGASQIFEELEAQVESQRHISPPEDGSVHKLLDFVTHYCNCLLGEDYKPTLGLVLSIRRSWNHEVYKDEVLNQRVHRIMDAIEKNLDSWSKSYQDAILSYIFMMNNHLQLSEISSSMQNLSELMGDSWLKTRKECVEYYGTLYLRESWGKLRVLLSWDEEQISSYSTSFAARNAIKKKLKTFNEAFEEMCRKQSKWVIVNRMLRDKICQLLVEALVPCYKDYLETYGHLLEQESIRFSPGSLENLLRSLFQPNPAKFGRSKSTHFVDKIKNAVAYNRRSSLAVA